MTSTTSTRRAAAPTGELLPVAVVALAAAAWLVLLWPAGHSHGSGAAGPSPVTGWALMVVAMMLPPALPLLETIRRLVARRRSPAALVAAGAAAFLTVWLLAGLGFLLGDLLLGLAAQHLAALRAHPEIPAGLAAVAAGLYQFTPAKRACLTACRSPRGIALAVWTGARPAAVEVAAIGWRFGLVCVGCCWSLMLLTFTVGAGAMPVMVAVSAVMLAERLLPRTRPLVPAVALGCVALGVLILVGAIPPGLLGTGE
jgi:predicted metal-binding membrane protein